MKILKAYRFKLKPNDEVKAKLTAYAGHCRFLWNYFWRLNQDRLQRGQRLISDYFEMDFWSKLLKDSSEYGFLKEAPAHILQQKLKDLSKAYKDGFNKNMPLKRLPQQLKKALHSTFRFPEPHQIQVDNRRIKLPKLGWIGFYKSRIIEGDIRNVTVSFKAGDWYISIQVMQELERREHPKSDNYIGLDMGIKQFAVGATKQGYHRWLLVNSFCKLEIKIAKEQRKLTHKQRYSNNWHKQIKTIQKLHTQAAHVRRHHLHIISTDICKNHATIFVEDLKIKNMSSSAKGNFEKPGRNVRAKSGLNKSILGQGWHMFKTMLEYKSRWSGGQVIQINPRYSSQMCFKCGFKDKNNRRSQANFKCLECGFAENADQNAARNILAAGLGRIGLCSELHEKSATETRENMRISTPLFA